MPRYPKEISDFMQEYGVRDNEVWQVPGGKSYAVKHSALERIAAEKRISFKPPQVLEADTSAKVVAMLVTANMGDQEVWSIGEAAPGNNKNAYVWSMAEKRGKDRCILKLLSIHGIIYSAEELDNQERDDTPRQDDYEAPGEPDPFPVNPDVDRKSAHFIKKNRPNEWPEIVGKFRDAKSPDELKQIAGGKYVQEMTKDWPVGFLDELRGEYQACMDAFKVKAAAE